MRANVSLGEDWYVRTRSRTQSFQITKPGATKAKRQRGLPFSLPTRIPNASDMPTCPLLGIDEGVGGGCERCVRACVPLTQCLRFHSIRFAHCKEMYCTQILLYVVIDIPSQVFCRRDPLVNVLAYILLLSLFECMYSAVIYYRHFCKAFLPSNLIEYVRVYILLKSLIVNVWQQSVR